MVQVVGKDNSVVKRVTCRNCGSILEYSAHEVKRRDGKDYTGGADGCEYIGCPNCGKEAIIRAW